jgi:flagellar biosynthesis protein FlhF
MRIRKFEAASVQQAMAKVRAELGENAVILHTRTCPGRFFGILGKPRVEITAALEDQQPFYSPQRLSGLSGSAPAVTAQSPVNEQRSTPTACAPAQTAAQEFLTKIERIRQTSTTPVIAANPIPAPPVDTPSEEPKSTTSVDFDPTRLEALEVRIDRLANSMERLLSLNGPLGRFGLLAEIPVEWHGCMKRLMESSLSEHLLNRIAVRLMTIPHPGVEFEQKILRELLAGMVLTTPPVSKPETGQRIITLVGPTGVGKTTTLAKLASGLVVTPKVHTKVGLITVDTYRLAAEDQLRKYAEILRLDLQVVYGPEEMPEALRKCHDADVIFIDTAGRSPRDETQMAELRSFLDPIPECEKFLVLSSTMNDRYIEEAVERFRPLSIHSLIVTKLDETRNYAAPFNIQHLTQIPVSYLTTGQNVPEDIEPVDPSRMADEILASVVAERAGNAAVMVGTKAEV